MLRPEVSVAPIVALVSFCLLGTAAAASAQASPPVRLTLLEASARAEARTCTLETVVETAGGEAILTCERRTPPVSHLGAHRALTATEVARLRVLAPAAAVSPPQGTSGPAPVRVDGASTTISIARGTQRTVVDVSEAPDGLSPAQREILQLLRAIANELRGTGDR